MPKLSSCCLSGHSLLPSTNLQPSPEQKSQGFGPCKRPPMEIEWSTVSASEHHGTGVKSGVLPERRGTGSRDNAGEVGASIQNLQAWTFTCGKFSRHSTVAFLGRCHLSSCAVFMSQYVPHAIDGAGKQKLLGLNDILGR